MLFICTWSGFFSSAADVDADAADAAVNIAVVPYALFFASLNLGNANEVCRMPIFRQIYMGNISANVNLLCESLFTFHRMRTNRTKCYDGEIGFCIPDVFTLSIAFNRAHCNWNINVYYFLLFTNKCVIIIQVENTHFLFCFSLSFYINVIYNFIIRMWIVSRINFMNL